MSPARNNTSVAAVYDRRMEDDPALTERRYRRVLTRPNIHAMH